jgi:GC-rich sequence DNA-binding factor
MVAKRRRMDDEDDLSLFLGSLPVQPPEAEETAELDEFGRAVLPPDPAVLRRERRSARVVRRTQRLARQTRKEAGAEEEGYSTDASLLPSEASDFDTALSKLSVKVNDVLSDVKSDEFKDPSVGLGRWFGEWRRLYSDSYTGAWGGLGMVGAWEFWVRLETVGWDPLAVCQSLPDLLSARPNERTTQDPRPLDSFAWYVSLYDYSRPRGDDHMEDDEEPPLGSDGDLVAAMLSTAVIPRLCKVLRGGAFDPYSSVHTRRVIDLAEQVEMSLEKSDAKFQASHSPVHRFYRAHYLNRDDVHV